ncbi:MAG: 2OG-Fe(II) oxygenase [Nitrospirales bacterium]|nr:2OG-Fe(II) oxygenase [Nitrospira sp.]MDR4502970.1 2OG-Fe(II) oxygenase [Nitrospirales bacterium]
MTSVATNTAEEVSEAITRQDRQALLQEYREQGEFLAIESFLSQDVIAQFMDEVEAVRPRLNRNFIPGHKKGGSVSYYLVKQSAPALTVLYKDPGFIEWLSQLAGERLLLCPEDDPHSCALYFYTEAGDHIGYHYDTSYYKGARYTVLIGLLDNSTSRLECRLHTKDPVKPDKQLSLATKPGSFVFFNGDKLYHAVTPLGQNEERIVLTLQYVTNPEMGRLYRWFSNMKDAVGYFGLPALFRRS